MSFPPVTIPDMVRLQKMLIDHLGIQRCWRSLADRWARCRRCNGRSLILTPWPPPSPSPAPRGTARSKSPSTKWGARPSWQIPDWNEGNYYGKHPPARGLAVARMVGHITYMSDASMREKFGRRLRDQNQFEVESYLRYRGSQFVDRFDANSYLYITKAMDYFDLTDGRHSLSAAFENVKARFLVISFTSDWLYPSYQSLEVVRALRGRNCDVAYCELPSDLRPRRVPGQRCRAVRAGPRIPGQHYGSAALRMAVGQSLSVAQAFVRELLGRSDYAIISELIEPNTRVLDLGCGEGELLDWLAAEQARGCARRRNLRARKAQQAIARGVSVFTATSKTRWPTCPIRLSITSSSARRCRKRARR